MFPEPDLWLQAAVPLQKGFLTRMVDPLQSADAHEWAAGDDRPIDRKRGATWGVQSRLTDVPALECKPRKRSWPPACQTATFSFVGLVPRVCGGDRLPPSQQLARGVIGNTPGFDPGIPGSSPGGPVPSPGSPGSPGHDNVAGIRSPDSESD